MDLDATAVDIPWPKDFPDFERLDTLLRCGICYDFLKTTLVTPCSHNFCSLCIRKYMQYKTSCPACFVETNDIELRNNRTLDEIIAIVTRLKAPLCKALNDRKSSSCLKTVEDPKNLLDYKVGRDNKDKFESEPIALESTTKVIKSSETASTKQHYFLTGFSGGSPSAQSVKNPLPEFESFRPKRSLFNGDLDFLESEDIDDPAPVSDLVTTESVNVEKLPPPVRDTIAKVVNNEVAPGTPHKSTQRSIDVFLSPTKKCMAGSSSSDVPGSPKPNTSSGISVTCPSCNVSIPERNINRHLDSCLQNDKKEIVRRKPGNNPSGRAPLPKLVYSLLNEKVLRKKLGDLNLSTLGDKKSLIKRHQRYVVLYNSECDCVNPRPVDELLRQLEKEEREENKVACKTWKTLQVNRKAEPKEIEKMHKQYLKEQKPSFEKLIEDLRRRQKKKAPPSATVTSDIDKAPGSVISLQENQPPSSEIFANVAVPASTPEVKLLEVSTSPNVAPLKSPVISTLNVLSDSITHAHPKSEAKGVGQGQLKLLTSPTPSNGPKKKSSSPGLFTQLDNFGLVFPDLEGPSQRRSDKNFDADFIQSPCEFTRAAQKKIKSKLSISTPPKPEPSFVPESQAIDECSNSPVLGKPASRKSARVIDISDEDSCSTYFSEGELDEITALENASMIESKDSEACVAESQNLTEVLPEIPPMKVLEECSTDCSLKVLKDSPDDESFKDGLKVFDESPPDNVLPPVITAFTGDDSTDSESVFQPATKRKSSRAVAENVEETSVVPESDKKRGRKRKPAINTDLEEPRRSTRKRKR